MATTTPTMSDDRPASVIAATVVLVLSVIVDLIHVAGALSGAPIPPLATGLFATLGIASLVAAIGLWGRQWWAAPLALTQAALTILLGVMGFFTAGSTPGSVIAAAAAILGLAVIALVTIGATRRATA